MLGEALRFLLALPEFDIELDVPNCIGGWSTPMN
jgi:hypothetical protein